MKNRVGPLIQALSLGATVAYMLMVFTFAYGWQGYTPLAGTDTLIAWAVVATIAMAYLFIEYVDAKVEMTPFEAALEESMSYLPFGAFWWVCAAWYHGAIHPTTFQIQVGLIFLMVVLVDVWGFSATLFSKMMSTMAVKPKAATK
ncbi:hypothetical protein HY413_03470 [Candidatus Kaiserbacteria bacterium]|nr:hypothetical protein [Candidatus Kaiserbacteria bacterium]